MPDASSAVLMTAGAIPLLGIASRRRHYDNTGSAATASAGLKFSTTMFEAAKRGFDVVASVTLLGLLSPVFAVVALLVWREEPTASVLYRRRVLCRQSVEDGNADQNDAILHEFDAHKFRTMRPDADAFLQSRPDLQKSYGERFKLDDDPRVTVVGQVLRATGLDELPQLVNVLRGEMSLVGPRIITKPELARYGADASKLLSVRPGITGWWQTNGWHTVSYAERVRLDLWYIQNRSLWRDCVVLCRTPFCLISEWKRSLQAHRHDC